MSSLSSAMNAQTVLHERTFVQRHAASPFLSFMVLSIGGVVVLNWVFYSTRGSVLLAMIFHAAANIWTDVVPIPKNDGFAWTMWAAVMGAVAVILVIAYGAKYLSRNPDLKAIITRDPIQDTN